MGHKYLYVEWYAHWKVWRGRLILDSIRTDEFLFHFLRVKHLHCDINPETTGVRSTRLDITVKFGRGNTKTSTGLLCCRLGFSAAGLTVSHSARQSCRSWRHVHQSGFHGCTFRPVPNNFQLAFSLTKRRWEKPTLSQNALWEVFIQQPKTRQQKWFPAAEQSKQVNVTHFASWE